MTCEIVTKLLSSNDSIRTFYEIRTKLIKKGFSEAELTEIYAAAANTAPAPDSAILGLA